MSEWRINTGEKGKLIKCILACGIGVLLWIAVISPGDTL